MTLTPKSVQADASEAHEHCVSCRCYSNVVTSGQKCNRGLASKLANLISFCYSIVDTQLT